MKRSEVEAARQEVKTMLAEAGIILADSGTEIEVADFGLGRYAQEGLGLMVRVNEPEYCSKWLTLRPGQRCPSHHHKQKKETFFVLSGEVELEADEQTFHLTPGRSFTILPGVRHTFASRAGAVIEEVSTHDENADSYFDDPAIVRDSAVEEDDEKADNLGYNTDRRGRQVSTVRRDPQVASQGTAGPVKSGKNNKREHQVHDPARFLRAGCLT